MSTHALAQYPSQVAEDWLNVATSLSTLSKELASIKPEDLEIGTTPKDQIARRDSVMLYRYCPVVEKPHVVPVLLVYALVGRFTVLDLEPDRSFIKKLLDRGLDVYAVDWGHPGRADRWTGIEDYVDDYIDTFVDIIRQRHNRKTINLLGVCQGGVLNLCYSALYQHKVANLAVTVTPVDFHADETEPRTDRGFVHVWTRGMADDDVDALVDTLGNLSGDLMGQAFSIMAPMAALTKFGPDLLSMAKDKAKLTNFLRMETWLADRPAHTGEALRQWFKDFYRGNRFAKNELMLGGRRVDLGNIRGPVLNIYAENDTIAPPPCSKVLGNLVGSSDYTELGVPGGHIGVFVGGKSQKVLPETIAKWFIEHV
jgi:polyhydroxyalkanoate synthase